MHMRPVHTVSGRDRASHATPSDAAWVLACYNSDNYVTNASKDKELSNDVAREREAEERWLLGSPAAGNPPFVICLRDPSPRCPANGVDPTLASFSKKGKNR